MPASALAAVPTFQVVLLSKNEISFRAEVMVTLFELQSLNSIPTLLLLGLHDHVTVFITNGCWQWFISLQG